MWTGRQTLSQIDDTIGGLRGEEDQLAASLRSATADVERLRKERVEALRELARIKLDEMRAGRLVGALDAGERRAAQLLEDQRLRLAALGERRDELLKEVAQAQTARDAAASAVESALADMEALRAKAAGDVQSSVGWQAAKRTLADAEAVAGEAEKKASSSEAELEAKRKPYDGDALFMYLWQRKFGTAGYQAGNFVRMMDRAVADFVGFNEVRPNYAALIEIPLRLREHATATRAEADERAKALADVERGAMVTAGIEPRERALTEARHKLASADQTLQDKNRLLAKLEEERTALVSGGTTPAYAQALDTIASADSTDDLAMLYQEARRTATSADDMIVRRLEDIDANISKAESEVGALRRSVQQLAQRRVEVQQVRDRFRNAGYDHPYAGFDNDGDIAGMLKRVLAGAVSSGVLWDLLQGGYSYRGPQRRQDSGSPFPFPIPGGGDRGTSGGRWREPSSQGDWSPDPDGSSNSSGGDDDRFTTGGSF